MKTLENHVILYDAECPMCGLYSKAFVRMGMLSIEGRQTYQHMPKEICPLVDQQRAVNEIALVDTETGEVSYGIKSLFKVIGHAIPVFNPLFSFDPFIWIMTRVYAFISYNRRVIIPANDLKSHTMKPTFSLKFRLAYLVFTWLVSGLIFTGYIQLISPLGSIDFGLRGYFVIGLQMLVQGVLLGFFSPAKLWDYLGNMMTISLAGALLLLPILLLKSITYISVNVAIFYIVLVGSLMLCEHIRRSRMLELTGVLTISWAVLGLVAFFI